MSATIQFRRDTSANWASVNPVLAQGELGLVTDTGQYKIGDGSTAWNSLTYSELTGTFDSLPLNNTTDPSPPTGGIIVYSKEVAGRSLPKFIPPSGLDSVLQNAIFQNRMSIAAPGITTALSYFGMGAMTAVGTLSHPVLASGSLRAKTSRGIVTSAATANSASELRYASLQCSRDSGFFAVFRFGTSSAVATQRLAVGLFTATTAIATTIEPSTLLNGIWIGNDLADTNLQLMCNDGVGTATKIDLGSDFVKNQAEGMYELTLFCKPTDTTIYYRIKRLDAAGEASGSLTTDVPAINTFLCPHFYLNNGGTASAVILDFYRYYLECDY
jgi:hypothetical protein